MAGAVRTQTAGLLRILVEGWQMQMRPPDHVEPRGIII